MSAEAEGDGARYPRWKPMNVEETMNFILGQQTHFEANFAKAEVRFARSGQRLDRLERLSAQNNRIVAKLAGYGRTLRSDVHRHEKTITAAHVRAEQAYERAGDMKAEAAIKSLARRHEERIAAAPVRAEQAYERAEEARKHAEQIKVELDAAMESLARTLEQFMRRNGK
jgi:hypothetical protein